MTRESGRRALSEAKAKEQGRRAFRAGVISALVIIGSAALGSTGHAATTAHEAAPSTAASTPSGSSEASTISTAAHTVPTATTQSSFAAGNAWTWGKGEGASPVEVLTRVTDTQAAHWGGLAISNGDVSEWTTPGRRHMSEIGLDDVASIGESSAHQASAAITSRGSLYTWGLDEDGQLCNGTVQASSPLTEVVDSSVVQVSGGSGRMLFLTSNHRVWACGENVYGQLGDGATAESDVPVRVRLPADIAQISAGSTSAVALDENGNVWAWGQNNFGQLGDGIRSNFSDVPVEVDLPAPAVEVYAGGSTTENGQSLALLSNGEVYGWGNDSWGQLGNDATEDAVATPVQATVLPSGVTWVYVATGGQDSFAIDSRGDLWEWGAPPDDPHTYDLTPSVVQTDVEQVSATAETVTTITKAK